MTRHSWARLKEHEYLCRRCGTTRVHVWDDAGGWSALWGLPDGTQDVGSRTPRCEPGVKTEGRLAMWRACGSPDVKKEKIVKQVIQ